MSIEVAGQRFPGRRSDPDLTDPACRGMERIAEIVRALERLAATPGCEDVDVVLLVRGGGSLEDLMGFNTEIVARGRSPPVPIPVLCGVGHEVDVTIADLVADVRAPTPSAAAELALPDRAALARTERGLAAARSAPAERLLRGCPPASRKASGTRCKMLAPRHAAGIPARRARFWAAVSWYAAVREVGGGAMRRPSRLDSRVLVGRLRTRCRRSRCWPGLRDGPAGTRWRHRDRASNRGGARASACRIRVAEGEIAGVSRARAGLSGCAGSGRIAENLCRSKELSASGAH